MLSLTRERVRGCGFCFTLSKIKRTGAQGDPAWVTYLCRPACTFTRRAACWRKSRAYLSQRAAADQVRSRTLGEVGLGAYRQSLSGGDYQEIAGLKAHSIRTFSSAIYGPVQAYGAPATPIEVVEPPVPSAQQLLPLLVHPVLVTVKFCLHEQLEVQAEAVAASV